MFSDLAERPPIYLQCAQPALDPLADTLAAELRLAMQRPREPEQAYRLQLIAADAPPGYRLRLQPPGRARPVEVDFVGGSFAHRLRHGGGRGQPLARAVGLRGQATPRVLDATAGLGRDGFILAWLGCSVTWVERVPVLGALLANGLERARHAEFTAAAAARLRLVREDARRVIERTGDRYDVIYLDPMYPERHGSALSKKEARLLRELVGDDTDADSLLSAALPKARRRVVVKRPVRAESLPGRPPDHCISGKTTRYDVYVTLPTCRAEPDG